MKFEDALLVAIEELSKSKPESSEAYLALMIRIGQIRAESPSDPKKVMAGKRRAAVLSPERRKEIAEIAAHARWKKP